jgi:hypothetical protein
MQNPVTPRARERAELILLSLPIALKQCDRLAVEGRCNTSDSLHFLKVTGQKLLDSTKLAAGICVRLLSSAQEA